MKYLLLILTAYKITNEISEKSGINILDVIYTAELVRYVTNEGGNPNFLLLTNKESLKAEVKYFYSSRNNERVKFDNTTFSLLNPALPVKFIIHGWGENIDKPYIGDIARTYLSVEDANIILVDWSVTARKPYPESAYLTKQVGNMIGDLINQITQETSVGLNAIHIIGHSLGGQVAGLAGKRIQALTNGLKVPRITALDPAGPYFTKVSNSERLTKTDATMVDVTHTDGGYFGYADPCGTVDFYPNGGTRIQPGCSFNLFTSVFYLLRLDLADTVFCSHTRSYHYFNASITATNLMGTECNSKISFDNNRCSTNQQIVYGDKTPSSAKGIYYFKTNASVNV